MKAKITNKYGPNFTILVPGKCNASCDFCFWDSTSGRIKPDLDEYIHRLERTLMGLPKMFTAISISGGEPTLSPYLPHILDKINELRNSEALDHIERVVLTTNGSGFTYNDGRMNLSRVMRVADGVTAINISRHAVSDEVNEKIFGTRSVPSAESINLLIAAFRAAKVPVTLNCVIDRNAGKNPRDLDFFYSYINMAVKMSAASVSFRKEASDVSATQAEKHFSSIYGEDSHTNCPVCRTMNQNIDGFPISWKGTVFEPSVDTDGIYELVFHPDGELYCDWGMKHKVSSGTLKRAVENSFSNTVKPSSVRDVVAQLNPTNPIHKKPPRKSLQSSRSFGTGSSGCGSSSCGTGSGGCGTVHNGHC